MIVIEMEEKEKKTWNGEIFFFPYDLPLSSEKKKPKEKERNGLRKRNFFAGMIYGVCQSGGRSSPSLNIFMT
jgi:hypothetical protein